MVKFKLPKYVNAWVDKRTGQVRCRFRRFRFGASVALPGTIGSKDFWAAYYAALNAAQSPVTLGADRTQPGTFDALIVAYYESGKFKYEYSDGTRAVRRAFIERFRAEHGGKRVRHLTPEYASSLIDPIKRPHAKRNFRKAMVGLLEFAVSIGMHTSNPFSGVKLGKIKRSEGHHWWNDEEVAQYRAYWPLGTQQRLTFELAYETGSRRGDVTQIGPQHIRQGPQGKVLRFKQQKTGTNVEIPITPELQAAIDAIPAGQRSLTFLTTYRGAQRSAKALGGDFRQWCNAAGLPKRCSLHGLRKAFLSEAAEGEATDHELMAMGGHKSLSEVQRYTETANRGRLAQSGMAKRRKARDEA